MQTLSYKGETSAGGKKRKDRVSAKVACNKAPQGLPCIGISHLLTRVFIYSHQVSDTQPWLQIDFPVDEWKITRITTWGGGQREGHVTVYRLAFKDVSTKWTEYSEGGRIRVRN